MNKPASLAKVGDIVVVRGSVDVDDGNWPVVEALPKSRGRLCNGGLRSRLCVKARRRQTPDWEPEAWWVEDRAIVQVL